MKYSFELSKNSSKLLKALTRSIVYAKYNPLMHTLSHRHIQLHWGTFFRSVSTLEGKDFSASSCASFKTLQPDMSSTKILNTDQQNAWVTFTKENYNVADKDKSVIRNAIKLFSSWKTMLHLTSSKLHYITYQKPKCPRSMWHLQSEINRVHPCINCHEKLIGHMISFSTTLFM